MEIEIHAWRKEFDEAKLIAALQAETIGVEVVAELLADPGLTESNRSMIYTELSEFFGRKALTEGRFV